VSPSVFELPPAGRLAAASRHLRSSSDQLHRAVQLLERNPAFVSSKASAGIAAGSAGLAPQMSNCPRNTGAAHADPAIDDRTPQGRMADQEHAAADNRTGEVESHAGSGADARMAGKRGRGGRESQASQGQVAA